MWCSSLYLTKARTPVFTMRSLDAPGASRHAFCAEQGGQARAGVPVTAESRKTWWGAVRTLTPSESRRMVFLLPSVRTQSWGKEEAG